MGGAGRDWAARGVAVGRHLRAGDQGATLPQVCSALGSCLVVGGESFDSGGTENRVQRTLLGVSDMVNPQ